MRKYFFVVTLIAVMIGGVSAQSRLAYSEFGLGAGTLNYAGDIGTNTSTSSLLKEVRPEFMAFAKRQFNDVIGMGIYGGFGWIHAEDVNHSNPKRGLMFTTTIFQVNPFLELNILRFGKFHYERKFSIFLRAGGGFMAYNPNPSAASVYPETMEPHTGAYSTVNFFMGGGFKFRLGYKMIMTLETEIHYPGVDDLDGVLYKDIYARGTNDVYGGVRVTFSRMIF